MLPLQEILEIPSLTVLDLFLGHPIYHKDVYYSSYLIYDTFSTKFIC